MKKGKKRKYCKYLLSFEMEDFNNGEIFCGLVTDVNVIQMFQTLHSLIQTWCKRLVITAFDV